MKRGTIVLKLSLVHIIAEGEFIFHTSQCASLKNTSANANVFFCAKATKKIFFAFFNKVSNSSNVNEVVRCTMKSSLGSDEARHYWFKRVFGAYHSRRRIHFSYIVDVPH